MNTYCYMFDNFYNKENSGEITNFPSKKQRTVLDNKDLGTNEEHKKEILSKEGTDSSKLNYFTKKRISLYKTEMCRSHEETGTCKYGDRCQFAHQKDELRSINRHPRYKTETCKTFWEIGTCPYGKRCCFVHLENKDLIKDNDILDFQIDAQQIPQINDNSNLIEQEKDDLLINTELDEMSCKYLLPEKESDSDDFLFSEIKVNEDQENLKKKKEIVKKLLLQQSFEEDNNEIQDMKPFWSNNFANIWMPQDKTFCFIKKPQIKFNKISGDNKTPGGPTSCTPDIQISEFVYKNLGL